MAQKYASGCGLPSAYLGGAFLGCVGVSELISYDGRKRMNWLIGNRARRMATIQLRFKRRKK